MPPSPGAGDGSNDDRSHNAFQGAVYGQLVQARDIHGGVTVNVPQAPPPPPADVSLDAPRPATAVHGREELLGVLGREMRAGAAVPHVLTGPGGFGKTTVAAELAGHARNDGWTVFWVRPDSVVPSMLEVAVELGGSRQEADLMRSAPRRAARWVWRHLDAAPRPWLLVVDSADRPEELDPENRPGDQLGWMRASPGGFVLVTSRVDDPLLWAPARVHRVDGLEAEAAASALADHAGLPSPPGADELVERLGGVPLALSLAGRILATHRVLFPDAHALLAHLTGGVGALDELAAPFVTGSDADRGLLTGVWELSRRLVAEREPQATPLLRLLAVLGPDAAPVPLRRLPLSELSGGVLGSPDEVSFARAVNALVVHGLVTVGQRAGETFLRLHPLVSETVRAGLTHADLPLLEHAERLLRWNEDHDLVLEMGAYTALHHIMARLRDDAAFTRTSALAHRAMMLLGDTETAERGLRRLVEQSTGDLGAAHPETMRARHGLGDALRAGEKIEEAEEVYTATAGDRERVLGPGHPDTLSTRHQVALMTGLRGDLGGAETGFRAVLDAHEGGRDTPIALQVAENLAHVRLLRGDAVAAEKRLREIMRVRSGTQGERHPGTLATAFSLAQALHAQERWEEAADAFAHVARVREEILGEDHPLTLAARESHELSLNRGGKD
ncbi:tetratricopeptide repeat protein [Nocardiopsis sp. CT-R113]|uniref:Tetratricopeptide repeat protein n=1 Tax=Nocardiopsis codii TaxID=3065942 RepID=A0ABU7K8X4_9ACTN|nr:tetratricopeptide repeat protein [Nocardiopsis sp. CT-R113]MEE2038691.1 tetratricopeptide repeat protein [Nocardiopsis sp. CT-R113]